MYCNVLSSNVLYVACTIPILLNIEVIQVQVHVHIGRSSCLLLYFSSKFRIQARFAHSCTMSYRLDIISMSWAKPMYNVRMSLHYRGKVKTEGWLILTENTLNWYDRDPLGGTRKPAHSCTFGSPEWTLVVLPSINKRSLPYAIPNKQLDESFGIEKIGVSSHEEIIFIARNIQSKIEWVEAIEKVLVSHSHPPQIDVAMSVISGDDQAEFSPTKAKELKAVSIVPLKGGLQRSAIDTLDTPTPPPRRSKRNISSSSRELDLSIRSSMFGSPSETSFI